MNHESPLHLLADNLIDYFEGSEAVNYIEETFTCNHDSSKSFVVTMQMINGLTPCEKLAKAEKLNADMYKAIEELIEMFEVEVFERYGETGLSDDDVAEYKQLLKRARGE